MADEAHLLQALDMLTEGGGAEVPEAWRAEAHTIQRCARSWPAGKGIQGVGIGEKITDLEKLDELVLKVYVARKLPKSKVKNLVPKQVKVVGLPEPLPIDVEGDRRRKRRKPNTTRAAGRPWFSAWVTSRSRPARSAAWSANVTTRRSTSSATRTYWPMRGWAQRATRSSSRANTTAERRPPMCSRSWPSGCLSSSRQRVTRIWWMRPSPRSNRPKGRPPPSG